MLPQKVQNQGKKYLTSTYNRFLAALASGSDVKVVDTKDRGYIDFGGGIGINSFGYCDPQWAKAVSEQAAMLQYISSLYYSLVSTQLGEKLYGVSGFSKVLFVNSGAKTNGGAVKLARKCSSNKCGEGRGTVITLIQSFHGCAVTTPTATEQERYHQYFTPFTPDLTYAKVNDLESVEALANKTACAMMLEMIQGEGDVLPLSKEFIQGVAAFCRENDILLPVDEVQMGIARIGGFLSFEQYDIQPGVVLCARGLDGDLPIGAVPAPYTHL